MAKSDSQRLIEEGLQDSDDLKSDVDPSGLLLPVLKDHPEVSASVTPVNGNFGEAQAVHREIMKALGPEQKSKSQRI